MKRTIISVSILLGSLCSETTLAQPHTDIAVNIDSQPVWGPVGYDHVEYYYLPDIDAFYFVPGHRYIYLHRGHWVFSASLPPRHLMYDLFSCYKGVVNDPKPYRNASAYRIKYAAYKGNRQQQIIRNSNEPKYFVNKDHPDHNKWKDEQQQHGNGRHHDSRKNHAEHN